MVYPKFIFFLIAVMIGGFAFSQNEKYPYQDNIEKLLINKKSQQVLDIVNSKLRNTNNENEINLLLCYKIEALIDFELYSDAILLSDRIIHSNKKNTDVLLQTYILRELTYEILEDFPKASIELDKAEQILEANPHLKPKFFINYLVRKSSLIRMMDKNGYEKYASQAISYSKETPYKNYLSSAYLLLGFYYRDRDFNKSFFNFQKAKEQCRIDGDIDGLIGKYINLADLYENKNDFVNIKKYLDSANIYINQTNQNSTKAWLFEKKADFFEANKQYDSALVNHKKYKKFYDLYDFSKKKMKLDELDYKAENIRQKQISEDTSENVKIVLGLLLFCVFVLIILGYLLRKIAISKNKIDKQNIIIQEDVVKQQKLLENRTFLLKELNHRIKNNFAIILSLINIQKDDIEDKKSKTKLEDLHSRIHTIALAQDLYQYNFDSNETKYLDLKKYFIDILQSIIHSNARKISYKMEAEDHMMIDTTDALPSGLIMNELLINSYKHAQNHAGDELEIVISLKKLHDKILLEYRDNGTYFEKEKNKDSLGLILIEGMVKQMNGDMVRKNFDYKITF